MKIKNRVVQYPNRYRMKVIQTLNDGGDGEEEKLVYLVKDEGVIADEGTPLNAKMISLFTQGYYCENYIKAYAINLQNVAIPSSAFFLVYLCKNTEFVVNTESVLSLNYTIEETAEIDCVKFQVVYDPLKGQLTAGKHTFNIEINNTYEGIHKSFELVYEVIESSTSVND